MQTFATMIPIKVLLSDFTTTFEDDILTRTRGYTNSPR